MRLNEEYVEQALRDARRFQGAWTGTSGTLGAHTYRLVMERKQLLATIDELERKNADLRAAVERRLAATHAEVPPEITGLMPNVTFVPAAQQKPAEFRMTQVSGSMPPDQLEAAWNAIAQKAASARKSAEPIKTERIACQASSGTRIIGISGRAGSGKNAVASMIPGASVIQLADPLYAALASMLGVPEQLLRNREFKGKPIAGLGRTPRQLLQTLGTEWGRMTVSHDIWINMAERRIEQFIAAGLPVVAIADVRFENEATWIRDCGGEVWHVYRDGLADDGHASEAGIRVDDRDRVIDNSGTLEDLRNAVSAAFAA